MAIIIKKLGRIGYFESAPDIRLERALFNNLCYQREGWQFMPNPAWSYVRFYNRKKRSFPWGLINDVIIALKQWQAFSGEEYKIIDDDSKKLILNPFIDSAPLRYYQLAAIQALCNNNGGQLSLPTGVGKSLTIIYLLKNINHVKALIIVTTRDLKQQWKDEIIKADLKDIDVRTYQGIKNLNDLKDYDVVITDESHHCSADKLYKIAQSCGRSVLIGLSATPFRAYKPETMKIRAAIGDIVYKKDLRDLIKEGYLCDARINIISGLDCPKLEYFDTYADVVEKCITYNTARNNKIIELASEESLKGTTLILVDKISHGEILFNKLSEINNFKSDNFVFVHGSSKGRQQIFEDIKLDKYKIIVASKIYNEGINFPNIKFLIMAGGGKSSVKIVQQVGRLLRIFSGKARAEIFDFKDTAEYLNKHFIERLKVYQDSGFEINGI